MSIPLQCTRNYANSWHYYGDKYKVPILKELLGLSEETSMCVQIIMTQSYHTAAGRKTHCLGNTRDKTVACSSQELLKSNCKKKLYKNFDLGEAKLAQAYLHTMNYKRYTVIPTIS